MKKCQEKESIALDEGWLKLVFCLDSFDLGAFGYPTLLLHRIGHFAGGRWTGLFKCPVE